MSELPDLSERQFEVLQFIAQHTVAKQYPPTLQEICERFLFASKSAAKHYLDVLTREQLIADDGVHRSIAITDRGRKVLGGRWQMPA